MITVLKQPGQYCFVGNPALFELQSENQDPVTIVIKYNDIEVKLTGYPYKSEIGYVTSIDISDVLKSFFDNGLPIYGETISIAEYPEFIRECIVTIDNKDYSIKAIDGGISDDTIIELNKSADDMFSYRLMNPERSLLFTTRTNSPNLILRESELFPFVFLHPGKPVTFISSSGNALAEKALLKGTPCLMDIAFVRRMFLQVHNELPAYLTIQIDGADSSYITITKSKYSEDMCWVVFKNSLGGYECIEITGKGYNTPEIGEGSTYQQHAGQSIFTVKRERLTIQDSITIQTGYKNQEELDFLMDMVTTNRAYLVYPDKRIVEVIPSIENPKYGMSVIVPTSMEIRLQKTAINKYHSPRIDLARPGAWIWDGIWEDYAYWFDGKRVEDIKE